MEIQVPDRMSDMLKTTVENRHGEKLGTIHDIMVVVGEDVCRKYAILSHGGFLGLGDVFIPIPFAALKTNPQKGITVLDIDKHTLERALNFESKTCPNFTEAEWEEKINTYFAACASGAGEQQSVAGNARRDQPHGRI